MAGFSGFDEVMDSLMKGMSSLMGAKTVVGDPTRVDDTIIVPLMDVSFGVGAGSSDQDKRDNGAGGFAAKLSPAAVLVIKDGATRLVNVKNQDAVTKLLDMIPDITERFSNKKKPEMMPDNEAIDRAFPEGTESKVETAGDK